MIPGVSINDQESDNRSDRSSIISTTSTLMSAIGTSGAKAQHHHDGGASASTVDLGDLLESPQAVKDVGAGGAVAAPLTDDAEPHPARSSIVGRDSRDSKHDEKFATSDSDMIDGRPKDVYDRFSPGRKKVIMAIVSYSAFISPVTSSILLPSIPQMATDLNTSEAVINYTVAIFLVTIGVAPLLWSPLSGFYGRRPVYLISMPIHVVASIGVALSRNVGDLIGTRILQGFGGSCVLAVGAGSIGDIFRPTERANAMGWYYCGALMGPSFAPLIGGLFTEYTALSWRASQYWLAGLGALSVFLTFFFLPETSHPPLPHTTLKAETGKKFILYRFNPLTSLGLFRWANIAAGSFVSSCVMLETYCFVVPLGTIFQTRYGITNVAVAACLYIANGGGNFIGTRIAGPLADRTVVKYMNKRGYRRPEDRLQTTLIPSGILMPISCLAYGWLVEYSAGGVGPPVVFLILSGISLMIILTPLNTYLVDCMQKRSAETIAVNNCLRYIFSAAASAFVLPLSDAIGWGWTMTIAAVISWLACGVLLLTLRYGHIWREKANGKYGMEVAEDEKHGVELEKVDGNVERGMSAEHEDENEHPGHLVTSPPLRGHRKNTVSNVEAGRGTVTRSDSVRTGKGEMPPVQEVLKRTVSLSGASVHGGG